MAVMAAPRAVRPARFCRASASVAANQRLGPAGDVEGVLASGGNIVRRRDVLGSADVTPEVRSSRLSAILRRAQALDPADLAYLAGSEGLSRSFWANQAKSRAELRNRSRLIRLSAFGAQALRHAGRGRGADASALQGAVTFSLTSENQAAAVGPVVDALEDLGVPVATIGRNGAGGRTHHLDAETVKSGAYAWALPFLPALAKQATTARDYKRDSYRWAADTYLHAFGLYVRLSRLLAKHRPLLVVVANDHLPFERCLVFAARDLGVPTAFVPHASVTSDFPPLMFGHAFLEGLDMLEKYRAAGPVAGDVYLSGVPKQRSAGATRMPSKDGRLRVCVCLNFHDPDDRVDEVLQALSQVEDLELSVRAHPRTPSGKRADLEARTMAVRARWSDAKKEPSDTMLVRTDVVVAGDSAVHLEAAIAGVSPVCYDFDRSRTDWYGFVKNGLTPLVDELKALLGHIEHVRASPDDPRARASRYNATVGTPHEGRSAELVAGTLAAVARRQFPSGWVEVERRVYTPAGT